MLLHDLIENLFHSRNMIQQRVKVLAVDNEDIHAVDRPHPGDARFVVKESHLAKELTRPQTGQDFLRAIDLFDHLDLATDQTVDPVTDVALSKNDFSGPVALIGDAVGSARFDLDDIFGQDTIQKPVDPHPEFALQPRKLGPVNGSPKSQAGNLERLIFPNS